MKVIEWIIDKYLVNRLKYYTEDIFIIRRLKAKFILDKSFMTIIYKKENSYSRSIVIRREGILYYAIRLKKFEKLIKNDIKANLEKY